MYINYTLKKIIVIGVLTTTVVTAFVFYAITYGNGFPLNERGIDMLGQRVIDKCKDVPYRPTCYEQEIPNLVGKISMEDAFRVTKIVQELDPTYAYCHVLAHKISFAEAERKQDDWRDIMTRCPFTMCNYGCLHGSLIERFRGEVLDEQQTKEAVSELQDVCEPRESWNPTELDQNMCYHALGHLAMYITGADVEKANSFCEKVSVREGERDYYEICVEGVYMTIYQGIDPEEIALVAAIKPEKNEVRQYCSQFEGVDYEACNREAYPLFLEDLKKPESLVEFCSYTTNEHGLWKCYATAISNITVDLLERNQLEQIPEYCLGLSGRFKSQCFANVAVRMVQIEPGYVDKAVAVCNQAIDNQMGEECFRDLSTFASTAFSKESSEFQDFCGKFPDQWKNKCLQGNY